MEDHQFSYLENLTASQSCERLGLKIQLSPTMPEVPCKDCIFLPVVIEKVSSAVDEFAVQMKARLIQKAKQGYTGWDNPEEVMDFSLLAHMSDDINSRNPVSKAVDIANRAMMLWYRHERQHKPGGGDDSRTDD